MEGKIKTFHISSDEAKANCLRDISLLPAGADYIVTIKNKKQTRSAAQHRLKWLWMGELEKSRAGFEGWSREKWNRYFKLIYIKPLLVSQDENYHEFFINAKKLVENAPDEQSREWARNTLADAIKTEWLTVKNMHEFMEMIDRHCVTKYGITLPVPDDLKWSYER